MKKENKLILFTVLGIMLAGYIAVNLNQQTAVSTPSAGVFKEKDTREKVVPLSEQDGARGVFINTCTVEPGYADYCGCVWEELVDTTTDLEFNTMIMDYSDDTTSEKSNDIMGNAVSHCLDKI